MRANSLFCLMCALTLGVCLVFPATAEQPGDKLLEVFEKDIAPEESLIPKGVNIADTFQPGKGDPIGTVSVIDGRVLAIHGTGKTAYPLRENSPLFTEDTLITEKKSKAGIEFNDGSFISLGTYTKLVLDRSVYDPSKTTRDSFLRLLFGKARFIVTKLAEYRSSKYQVKTPTAVVGVRGSDFAVAVAHSSPLATIVAANDGTSVLVAGDTGPAQFLGGMEVCKTPAGSSTSIPVPSSYYPSEGFLPRGTKQVKAPEDSVQKQDAKKPWTKDPKKLGIVGGGVGVIAVGLALSNGGDGGSPSGLTVTASPPAGTTIGGAFSVSFTFSRPINPASFVNFTVTPVGVWNVTAVNNVSTTQVDIDVSPISTPTDATVQLLNITGQDNSTLQPPTSFFYPFG